MEKYGLSIIMGLVAGILARIIMLRSDYRHYPGYPHGYVSHLSFGFIAAGLGAVATPSLLDKNFVAVTFLSIAAQQFREIRSMERESLEALEDTELVPRGKDYIEGIAKVFESRNYLVIGTSLLVSTLCQLFGWLWGIVGAIIGIIVVISLMKGQLVRDIAEVVPVDVTFEGTQLKLDNIIMMNVGLKEMRDKIKSDGLAVLIKPKNDNGRETLGNIGQRQAIANIAVSLLGTKKEVDTPEFNPMLRKDVDTGKIAFYMVPIEKDIEILIDAVKKVPVLESAKREPLSSKLGRRASD